MEDPPNPENAKEWDIQMSKSESDNRINSNPTCSPDPLQTLVPQPAHLQNFTELLSSQELQVVKPVNRGENPARFQRTELWRPVYSWLESLDLDDVIGSKEISDWMDANPEVYRPLCSKHSRHHLLHYVKKCHIKILKRRMGKHFKPTLSGRKAGEHLDMPNMSAAIFVNPLTNVPKDSVLYRVKREEAIRKCKLLIEFEEKLSAIIPQQNAAGSS